MDDPVIHRPAGSLLETSKVLVWVLLLACSFILMVTVVVIPELGARGAMVDFDAFYIAGQMARAGAIAQAYDPDIMREAQTSLTGGTDFMPWTYPPQFDLVVALLPSLPRGLSFLAFVGASFAVYVLILHRLAGRYLAGVLLAVLPGLWMTLRTGQNGCLIASLVGLFCIAGLRGRAVAGLPLGLMIIKPHLAIGLGVAALASRLWAALLVAVLVAVLASGLATLVFGTEVWPAFLGATREATDKLQSGSYKLYRMTSVYAALHTMGVPPRLAMMAQAAVAVFACGVILLAGRMHMLPRRLLGLSCLATLAFSPYAYDYDMTILGIGLALLASDLLETARPVEKIALLGLAWLSSGWGLFLLTLRKHFGVDLDDALSLAAVGHVLLVALVWHILRRAK